MTLRLLCNEKNATCFSMADKIKDKKKSQRVGKAVSEDCYDMFHSLTTITGEADNLNSAHLRKVVSEHLTHLIEYLDFYFPSKEDPRRGNSWIQIPFLSLKDNLNLTAAL